MAKKADTTTEPKSGVGEMRTVDEKRRADAASRGAAKKGEPDPAAVAADPNTPNAVAAGTVEDEMPGVTDPREKLTTKRVGQEATDHLMSGPHAPEVTIIDGEPLKTGGTGQPA